MKQRVVFGAAAAGVFLPLLVLGGTWFHFFAGLLAMIAVGEIFRMRQLEVFSFEGLLAMLGAFVLTVPMGDYFSFLPLEGSLSAFTMIAFLILSGMAFNFPRYRLEDASFAIATSFYMGIGFHNLVNARTAGLNTVLFALFIVWATDIGAYVIGRRLGRQKLAPRLSPNKSREGFIGGILSAVAVATVFLLLDKTAAPYGLFAMLPMVALFSMVAQFGDLVESAIKRHYRVKDSGKIIPGHGGIFDRFDSLIFVLPLMHFFGLF